MSGERVSIYGVFLLFISQQWTSQLFCIGYLIPGKKSRPYSTQLLKAERKWHHTNSCLDRTFPCRFLHVHLQLPLCPSLPPVFPHWAHTHLLHTNTAFYFSILKERQRQEWAGAVSICLFQNHFRFMRRRDFASASSLPPPSQEIRDGSAWSFPPESWINKPV